MKRLVYHPRVDAWVKTDTGVVDISPFIVRGEVHRRTDAVSSASLTLRNPTVWDNGLGRSRLAFTESVTRDRRTGQISLQPLFHPMDPITITLTRLRDKPIQVFTGFVDKSPYLQLHPEECILEASCTLKRLQHTFFDPGLPFFHNFLAEHGWEANERFGIINQEAAAERRNNEIKDPGFGALLYAVLREIGGWDDTTIWIEELPEGIVDHVTELFNEFKDDSVQALEDFTNLLKRILGTSGYGNGIGDPGASPGDTTDPPLAGATDVFYVGDSLGVGTKDHLEDDAITFDVRAGRHSNEGIEILKQRLRSRHGVIVFDLGTNDTVSVLEQSLGRLARVAGSRNIVLATVNGSNASAKNRAIRRFAERDNVNLVDWAGEGPLASDGIHATSEGYKRRAEMFRSVLQSVMS